MLTSDTHCKITENSDFLTIHDAFSSWRRTCANGQAAVRKFCRDNFISHQVRLLPSASELNSEASRCCCYRICNKSKNYGSSSWGKNTRAPSKIHILSTNHRYLIDSSFIIVDQSVVRELNRYVDYLRFRHIVLSWLTTWCSARFGSRGRIRFVSVPPQCDQNSSNVPLINAALAAGLYPKLLSIVPGKDGRDKLVTITNNQAVALHPSSVNVGRRPRDFGVNYLSYFTIM